MIKNNTPIFPNLYLISKIFIKSIQKKIALSLNLRSNGKKQVIGTKYEKALKIYGNMQIMIDKISPSFLVADNILILLQRDHEINIY